MPSQSAGIRQLPSGNTPVVTELVVGSPVLPVVLVTLVVPVTPVVLPVMAAVLSVVEPDFSSGQPEATSARRRK